MLNEGNQKHNFISSSGSGTVINYGSGSDFLTSYGSYGSGSGSTTLPGGVLRDVAHGNGLVGHGHLQVVPLDIFALLFEGFLLGAVERFHLGEILEAQLDVDEGLAAAELHVS